MASRPLISILYVYLIMQLECAVFEDMEHLHFDLNKMSRYIKPRINQTDSVNIDIYMLFGAIQDFDEISGTLTFTSSFIFFWNDEIRRWDPEDYGGIYITKLPILKTWMPMVFLRNGVHGYSFYTYNNDMEIATSKTTYYSNGDALFVTFGFYGVTCESDVTYYPFDEHKCTIMILSPGFQGELTLSSEFGIYLDSAMPNGEWAIKPNSAVATKRIITFQILGATTKQDQVEFTIVISREYLFPFLNIMLPVVLLSLAHLLVFLLPVDSSERTSFSYTLLLTLVVFMTMISERLPPTNNISFFNMYLLSQLFSSILTTSLAVISIRVFYKQSNVSQQGAMYRMIIQLHKLSCRDWLRRKQVEDSAEMEENVADIYENITSQQVSTFFDRLCFWFLCVFYGLELCIYLLVITFRKKKFE